MSSILVEAEGKNLLLTPLEARLFVGNISDIKKECESLDWEAQESIVIDMDNVEFIDSTGIGFLIGIHKRWNKGAEPLKLVNLKSSVRLVIDLLNISNILKAG